MVIRLMLAYLCCSEFLAELLLNWHHFWWGCWGETLQNECHLTRFSITPFYNPLRLSLIAQVRKNLIKVSSFHLTFLSLGSFGAKVLMLFILTLASIYLCCISYIISCTNVLKTLSVADVYRAVLYVDSSNHLERQTHHIHRLLQILHNIFNILNVSGHCL